MSPAFCRLTMAVLVPILPAIKVDWSISTPALPLQPLPMQQQPANVSCLVEQERQPGQIVALHRPIGGMSIKAHSTPSMTRLICFWADRVQQHLQNLPC